MNDPFMGVATIISEANTPLGVVALAIIGWVIVRIFPAARKFIGMDQKISSDGVRELKPALAAIVNGMEKMSGNDLKHLYDAVELVGLKIDRRMDDFDNKLSAHDKQAGEILTEEKEARKTLDRVFERCLAHKS